MLLPFQYDLSNHVFLNGRACLYIFLFRVNRSEKPIWLIDAEAGCPFLKTFIFYKDGYYFAKKLFKLKLFGLARMEIWKTW